MSKIDVWVIRKTGEILVTDFPGPPADVVVIIDKEDYDKKGPTIGNLGFEKDCYKGFDDEEAAIEFAKNKAAELGYKVTYSWSWAEGKNDFDF